MSNGKYFKGAEEMKKIYCLFMALAALFTSFERGMLLIQEIDDAPLVNNGKHDFALAFNASGPA